MSECVCTSCQTPFLRTSSKTKKCKNCLNAGTRAWYHANKEKANAANTKRYHEKKHEYGPKQRETFLQRKYNLSAVEYDTWRESVECCAICGGGFGTKGPQLDHCHTTGKVRDFLCSPCNLGLGLFDDSRENLKAAINYLEKHGRACE